MDRRLTRERKEDPGEKNKAGSHRKGKDIAHWEGEPTQQEGYRQRSQDAGPITNEIGDAKEAPALIHRKDLGDHILPAHNDDAGANILPGVQDKEQDQCQKRLPDCQKIDRRNQQEQGQAFQEKAECHREELLPGARSTALATKSCGRKIPPQPRKAIRPIARGLAVKWLTNKGQNDGG